MGKSISNTVTQKQERLFCIKNSINTREFLFQGGLTQDSGLVRNALNSWVNSGRINWHLPISAQTRYVRKIASIERVCVFRIDPCPYRFERAHDSGDMEAQTPQEDEVFFDCEHPNVYQGICVVFRC